MRIFSKHVNGLTIQCHIEAFKCEFFAAVQEFHSVSNWQSWRAIQHDREA